MTPYFRSTEHVTGSGVTLARRPCEPPRRSHLGRRAAETCTETPALCPGSPRGDCCGHAFVHFRMLQSEKHYDSELGPDAAQAHPLQAAPSTPARPQPPVSLGVGLRMAAAPSCSRWSLLPPMVLRRVASSEAVVSSKVFLLLAEAESMPGAHQHVSLPLSQLLLDGICLPAGNQALFTCLSLVTAALGRAV